MFAFLCQSWLVRVPFVLVLVLVLVVVVVVVVVPLWAHGDRNTMESSLQDGSHLKVKPSNLNGAGDGLFTTQALPKNTVFGNQVNLKHVFVHPLPAKSRKAHDNDIRALALVCLVCFNSEAASLPGQSIEHLSGLVWCIFFHVFHRFSTR